MNKNKRELLKGLAMGSAWATPVVSGVILPAHGSTSCDGTVTASVILQNSSGSWDWEIRVATNGGFVSVYESDSGVGAVNIDIERVLPANTTTVGILANQSDGNNNVIIRCCVSSIGDFSANANAVCGDVSFADNFCTLTPSDSCF